MKEIDGDLIELANKGEFDVIGHGCNCFHTMGHGLAVSMKKAFPEIVMADQCSRKGDKYKLGTFTQVDYEDLTVLNLYTQYSYSNFEVSADYDAIRKCMKEIRRRYAKKRIGLPMIGAGLAKGDWSTIKNIIEEELKDMDVTIVHYKK
jgi:O-acetyl-ADP-ribose deacetylase (regulator of RNase III)